MEHHGLLTRKDLLRLAQDEIFNPDFTHQRNARANALMDLSQKIPDGTEERSSPDSAEHRALDDFLRARKESRDLGLSTQTQTTATSVLVDQAFRDEISFALREVDQLHDPDVVTFIRTPKGTPLTIPEMDETSQQAVAILEGAEDDTGTQGDAAADPILACKMSTPPTYRSGFVRASFELVQDTAFPFTDLLMRAFAIRFSRRLGPVLVASLLGSALQGPTVIGDENQDSPDPTSQVGYFD